MSSSFFSPGRHHAVWKQWRRIGQGKEPAFFLEHFQAVLESLSGEHPPEEVLLCRELYQKRPVYWEQLAESHPEIRWCLVEQQAIEKVVTVPSHTGLCGVYVPRPASLTDIASCRFVLVAWELADPGNLGTLIRIGKAIADGALLLVGGCSPWSAKVARASAGSLLSSRLVQVPLEEGRGALLGMLETGFSLHATYPEAECLLPELEWGEKTAVLLGNETRGLPEELKELCLPLKIPMASGVESLNVATAGAIISWEWRRSLSDPASAG